MSQRILFVVHHPLDRNAGVAGATVQLASALAARGWNSRFYSFDDAFGKSGRSDVMRMLAFPFCVARHLWRNARHFDVIDATTGDTWLWLSLGRPGGAHVRVVTHSHGLEHVAHRARLLRVATGEVRLSWKYPLYHGGWRLREVNTTLRSADGTVFVGATDRDWAVRELGIDAARAVAIPNALPDGFMDIPPPAPRSPGAPLRIAVVGAWIDRKGSKVIAAAARELDARGVKVCWTLLGTHVDAATIAGEFPAGVRNALRVVPSYARTDLPRLLADSQVFLLPSWSEGFNMSLVEAMACGLAPIATDVGDARAFVRDDTGVLVGETAGASEIADAIVMLDRTPRLEALRHGAQRAVNGLRWSTIADRTIAFYESIAAA